MTRRARVTVAALAALGVLWALAVFVLVPWLIRVAHGGGAVPVLGAMLEGRAQHPVEEYLGRWRRFVLLASAAAAGAVGLLALVFRFRAALARRLGALVRTPPVVGAGETVLIGAFLGFASGLVEAASALGHLAASGDPLEAPDPRVLWMAPLAAMAAGALAGTLLALLLRARRGLALRVPVALFGMAVVFVLIVGLRLHLHHAAVLLLAAGISARLAVWCDAHEAAVRPAFRHSVPWMAAAIVLAAAGMQGAARLQERRALARLGPASAGAPNVLLLILDTVRGQSLSLYGYGRRTSPALERWADSGVVFDNAIVPAPWTLPTHASMFTGLPPHALTADFHRGLDRTHPTLADVMDGYGYATAAFVGNMLYASRFSGLDRGFAVYRDFPLSLPAVLASSRWSAAAYRGARRLAGNRRELVRKTAADVNREFLAWQPPDGRPWFAFLNFYDAHTPYETQAPFDRRFTPEPPRWWRYESWSRYSEPHEIAEMTAAYDATIAYMDDQVGQLLDELERRGTLRNTVVIIVGDHGEHLGEHGIFSHANSLYLPLLRVPLLVVQRGRVPAGRRFAAPAGAQDLAATVLELAGLTGRGTLPGRSLARFWTAADGPGTDTLVSELSTNDFAHRRDPVRRGPMRSVIIGDLHYIRNGDGVEELYDIAADPAETQDLAASARGSALLPDLRRALEARLAP